MLTAILFVASSFIPCLREQSDSPPVSPAELLVFGQAGPCNSAAAFFAILRFSFVSFIGCAIVGWILQAILRSIFEHEQKPDA